MGWRRSQGRGRAHGRSDFGTRAPDSVSGWSWACPSCRCAARRGPGKGAAVMERLLVVGGDAAGMSAASQARRRRGPARTIWRSWRSSGAATRPTRPAAFRTWAAGWWPTPGGWSPATRTRSAPGTRSGCSCAMRSPRSTWTGVRCACATWTAAASAPSRSTGSARRGKLGLEVPVGRSRRSPWCWRSAVLLRPSGCASWSRTPSGGCHAGQSLRVAVPVRLLARRNGDDLEL